MTLPPTTPTLQTERLTLRPLRLDDAPAVQRQFPHWTVIRHLRAGIPWPFPDDGAEVNARESLEKIARGELAAWAITLKGGDDALIGRIDLRPDAGDHEMRGFWLAQDHWGRGLMTEAANAVTDFALIELAWPHLYVTNAADNTGSHRIKQKQGFELVEVVDGQFVEGPRRKEVWKLTREAWMGRR